MSKADKYTIKDLQTDFPTDIGTIFHKSVTPLTTWFYALSVSSNVKSGITAKELERQIGVTYKCAILYA